MSHSNNWEFDVQWCSRNPDYVSVSSFDGRLSIYSLQEHGKAQSPTVASNSLDPFAIQHQHQATSQFSLSRPPRWLRRPVSAVWGFGGRLVSFDSNQPGQVTIRQVSSDNNLL